MGRLIREELKDDLTQIVYISSKRGYSMDLFENRPLNFLMKPLTEEMIIKSLQKSMELSQRVSLQFEFKNGRNICKIPYKNIMYFKSNNKKISIVTANENKEFYDKLSSVYKSVPSEYFVLIHKSYLVNYLYVSEYRHDAVRMTNGEILPISQMYRKEVSRNLLKRRKGRW